jgi:hypothetical protein
VRNTNDSKMSHFIFLVTAVTHCQTWLHVTRDAVEPCQTQDSNLNHMLLPVDIFDHLFSFLVSDPVTLKACSETHPVLSRLAERHLYATLTLLDGNRVDHQHGMRTSDLDQLLSDTHRIRKFVQAVEVKVTRREQYQDEDLEDISSSLSKLSLLKKITLTKDGSEEGKLRWPLLPDHFRRAFMDCARLDSMEELCMVHISRFPMSLLDGCKTVSRLTLQSFLPVCDFAMAASGYSLYPPLKSLRVHNTRSLDKMTTWIQSRKLRFLSHSHTYPSFHDSDVFLELLQKCSDSITSLDFSFDEACMAFSLAIS